MRWQVGAVFQVSQNCKILFSAKLSQVLTKITTTHLIFLFTRVWPSPLLEYLARTVGNFFKVTKNSHTEILKSYNWKSLNYDSWKFLLVTENSQTKIHASYSQCTAVIENSQTKIRACYSQWLKIIKLRFGKVIPKDRKFSN